MVEPIDPPQSVTDSLTTAMVASSDAPLLLLDGELRVIAASHSFGHAFHVDSAGARGQLVFDLGAGEWDSPRLRSLLTATASGHAAITAYELDLERRGHGARRLVIKAQKLQYGDADATRLLMTVSDVTEARIAEKLKDDLIREKAVLLQEVQHRIANSLQIIASVLLQSARNVDSEETRTHLTDAHNRVMSISKVQKQLALSGHGEVELRPYFTQLCQSLGASMIRDHNKQSITVSCDKSIVAADISISLGLIVTELVINALKHAFPDGQAGAILVDYQSHGPNWTLSVNDDGVGIPTDVTLAPPGLGTSIIEALAGQLKAQVKIAPRNPGTAVSVARIPIAAVGGGEDPPFGRIL